MKKLTTISLQEKMKTLDKLSNVDSEQLYGGTTPDIPQTVIINKPPTNPPSYTVSIKPGGISSGYRHRF